MDYWVVSGFLVVCNQDSIQDPDRKGKKESLLAKLTDTRRCGKDPV